MDLIQTIEFTQPEKTRINLPDFRDKDPQFYTFEAWADENVEIEYVSADFTKIQSLVDKISSLSNSFLPISDGPFVDIPVSISATIDPDAPLTWRASFSFPRTIEEYVEEIDEDYGIVSAPLDLTGDYLNSYSFSLNLSFTRFAQDGELRGLKFSRGQYNISATTFKALSDPETLLHKFFMFQENPANKGMSENPSESSEGSPSWTYDLRGTLRSQT